MATQPSDRVEWTAELFALMDDRAERLTSMYSQRLYSVRSALHVKLYAGSSLYNKYGGSHAAATQDERRSDIKQEVWAAFMVAAVKWNKRRGPYIPWAILVAKRHLAKMQCKVARRGKLHEAPVVWELRSNTERENEMNIEDAGHARVAQIRDALNEACPGWEDDAAHVLHEDRLAPAAASKLRRKVLSCPAAAQKLEELRA